MNHVILGLGSNLGDRRLNLSRAVRGIEQEFGMFEISHVVESEPEGFDSIHKFLNMCVIVQTDITPEQVLEKVKSLEASICPESHRSSDGKYVDRIIDIDILAIDDIIVDTPDLKIPHHKLHERSFCLEPMQEIVPDWHHPIIGLTPAEMLVALSNKDNKG